MYAGTPVLRTAYNENMETLVAMLLLAYAEKDKSFQETLKRVIGFYRENRELLLALAGKASAGAEEDEGGTAESKKAPPDPGESLKLLDELLKKL